MTEAVEVTYRLDRPLLAAAQKVHGRIVAGQGWRAHVPVVLGAALFVAVLLGAARVLGPGAEIAVLAGAGLGFGAAFLVVLFANRRMRKAVLGFEDRRGDVAARFAPAGLEFRSAFDSQEIAWPAIDAVLPIEGGTALLSGGLVHAVPDAALPEGLTPEAFRDRLNAWLGAA